MRSYNLKLRDSKWVKFPDDEEIQFSIRVFPHTKPLFLSSMGDMSYDDKLEELTWLHFKYCVVDWKGINGQDDKPLECNDENKKLVFDNDPDLVLWITPEIQNMSDGVIVKKK